MRVPGWVWAALPVVVTIAAVTAVQNDHTAPLLVPPGAAGVDEAWADLGMPPRWAQWGRWVALGESGWHITAQNGKPSSTSHFHQAERAAAWQAYERLAEQGRWPCPPVPQAQAPGSGGWYGQLWPLTSVFLAEKYGSAFAEWYCDPVAVWRNPRLSTIAHIAQVRGTLAIARRKLDGGSPTWLQLRALYGNPSRDPRAVDTAERRAAYTKSSGRAGLPPSWLDESVGSLPSPSLGIEASSLEADAELDAEIVAAIAAHREGDYPEAAA